MLQRIYWINDSKALVKPMKYCLSESKQDNFQRKCFWSNLWEQQMKIASLAEKIRSERLYTFCHIDKALVQLNWLVV